MAIRPDRDLEEGIIADLNKEEAEHVARKQITDPVENAPLPAGFDNPPCGTPGHRCLDKTGKYRPDFVQILIERREKNAMDPHPVRAGDIDEKIPLETWKDVHPGILAALRDSTMVVHEQDYNDKARGPGENPPIRQRPVRRFSIQTLASA